MTDTEADSKMSESVLTETIINTEKNDSPSKAKSNSLRHRKVPSADLNNVSVFLIICS